MRHDELNVKKNKRKLPILTLMVILTCPCGRQIFREFLVSNLKKTKRYFSSGWVSPLIPPMPSQDSHRIQPATPNDSIAHHTIYVPTL